MPKTKTKNTYQWKSNIVLSQEGINKLDVDKIALHIEKIRNKNGGFITPEMVVEESYHNPKSPLGECFSDTSEEYAHKYRLQIARSILGNIITINVDHWDNEIASMHLLSVPTENGRAYTDKTVITSTPDIHESLILQAKSELASWTRRYGMIEGLSGIVKRIREGLDKNE
jgi:hypothetical protein